MPMCNEILDSNVRPLLDDEGVRVLDPEILHAE